MPYKSQDLQQICANFISQKTLPKSLKQAAAKYSPRLGLLLRSADKKVFESDLALMANFLQNSSFSKNFSPNQYYQPKQVQNQFHKEIYALHLQKKEEKFKKSEHKQKLIEQRLNQLRNPLKSKEIAQAIKKANIYQARKLSEKQERARQYVHNLVQTTKQTNKDHNVAKSSKHNPLPIKPSDLVV